MAKEVQTIEEELVSVVCRSVNGLQQEMSIVGVLVLNETLADMLEIPVGTEGGELLEVTTKNHDRAMRKLPNRLPKSSELSVVVLGDLVADEKIVPEQRNTRTRKPNPIMRVQHGNHLNSNKIVKSETLPGGKQERKEG